MIGTKYVFNYVNLFSNENQQKIHENLTSIARLFVVYVFLSTRKKRKIQFSLIAAAMSART